LVDVDFLVDFAEVEAAGALVVVAVFLTALLGTSTF
jgi:hypothetical protein